MEEQIGYYSEQNERLDLALNPNLTCEPNNKKAQLVYEKIAQNEDEARKRQLTTLVQNGRKSCEDFLSRHFTEMEENLELVFGKDGNYRNILRDIYEKLEDDDEEDDAKGSDETINIFQRSLHFINVKYQETCPRCSGTAARNTRAVTTRDLAIYERAKFSKKSSLVFNTQHKGMVVQVCLLLPCPACCDNVLPDQLEIQLTPCLEHQYVMKEKLLEGPKMFVEECIWSWINDHK